MRKDNNIEINNYNSQILVEMWGDFIDWNKRRKGEDDFLVKQLEKHKAKNIFEAALGDACDAIYLIQKGFYVIGNEVDPAFLKKSLDNAKKNKITLKTFSLDWRELDNYLKPLLFDSIIITGNSLSYLLTRASQLKALAQFYRLLKKGGILIIDERNYQKILDSKKNILGGKFKYSKKCVYCGKKVQSRPVKISDKKITFKYSRDNKKVFLTMYPFKRGELATMLRKTRFQKINQFFDYSTNYNKNADFIQYVCVK